VGDGVSIRVDTLRFADVAAGDDLPELRIPITPTLIISTAIATRDFQAVHHDKDHAIGLGSKDLFMNILSTNGLVGRYVTDWCGPEAEIRKVSIRLGVPNYPGDEMRLSGRVLSKGDPEADGSGAVEVEVVGRNQLGDHVTGTVVVRLP